MEEKPLKPTSRLECPICGKHLYISSLIPQNGQVNFWCIKEDCGMCGFIIRSEIYFNFPVIKEDNA
jgi:C4-type Zn-finger protein